MVRERSLKYKVVDMDQSHRVGQVDTMVYNMTERSFPCGRIRESKVSNLTFRFLLKQVDGYSAVYWDETWRNKVVEGSS